MTNLSQSNVSWLKDIHDNVSFKMTHLDDKGHTLEFVRFNKVVGGKIHFSEPNLDKILNSPVGESGKPLVHCLRDGDLGFGVGDDSIINVESHIPNLSDSSLVNVKLNCTDEFAKNIKIVNSELTDVDMTKIDEYVNIDSSEITGFDLIGGVQLYDSDLTGGRLPVLIPNQENPYKSYIRDAQLVFEKFDAKKGSIFKSGNTVQISDVSSIGDLTAEFEKAPLGTLYFSNDGNDAVTSKTYPHYIQLPNDSIVPVHTIYDNNSILVESPTEFEIVNDDPRKSSLISFPAEVDLEETFEKFGWDTTTFSNVQSSKLTLPIYEVGKSMTVENVKILDSEIDFSNASDVKLEDSTLNMIDGGVDKLNVTCSLLNNVELSGNVTMVNSNITSGKYAKNYELDYHGSVSNSYLNNFTTVNTDRNCVAIDVKDSRLENGAIDVTKYQQGEFVSYQGNQEHSTFENMKLKNDFSKLSLEP